MGVKGLQRHAQQQNLYQILNLSSIATQKSQGSEARTICVDGNGLVHYLYTYPHPFLASAPLNWALGGQYAAFEKVITRFVNLFEESGIRLVVYFDGLRGELKSQVSIERRAKDAKVVSVCMQNITSPRTYQSQSSILPVFALETLMERLKTMGIEVHFSELEADKDLALYCKSHPECMGILGRDSDFLIYDLGEEKYYFNLDALEFRLREGIKREDRDATGDPCEIICEAYSVDRTAEMLKIDKRLLPLLACMMGNDYTTKEAPIIHNRLGVRGTRPKDIISAALRFLSSQAKDATEMEILKELFKSIPKSEERKQLFLGILYSTQVYCLQPVSVSKLQGTQLEGEEETETKEKEKEKEEKDKEVEEKKEEKEEGGTISNNNRTRKQERRWLEQVIKEDYKRGRLSKNIFSVMEIKEFWGKVVMQDFQQFDAYEVMEPLRRCIYGILFQELSSKTNQVVCLRSDHVALYSQTTQTFRKKKVEEPMVQVKGVGGVGGGKGEVTLARFKALRGDTDGEKEKEEGTKELKERQLETFFHVMRCDPSEFRRSVPECYWIGCAVLRFLLVSGSESPVRAGKQPLLTEWELDGFLSLIVRLRERQQEGEYQEIIFHTKTEEEKEKEREIAKEKESEEAEESDDGFQVATGLHKRMSTSARKRHAKRRRTKRIRKMRAVCLSSLYQVGLEHCRLVNEACGSPIEVFPPKDYFDGFLWYDCYRKAYKRFSEEEEDGNENEEEQGTSEGIEANLKASLLHGLKTERKDKAPLFKLDPSQQQQKQGTVLGGEATKEAQNEKEEKETKKKGEGGSTSSNNLFHVLDGADGDQGRAGEGHEEPATRTRMSASQQRKKRNAKKKGGRR